MKNGFKGLMLAACLSASLITTACSESKETWTVTCPWAPSGVAAVVSQKVSTLSTKYSDKYILVSEAIKGDAATVNNWVMDKKADDPNLVFVGEGLLSITSTIDPKKMKFTQDDFSYVENLYSSIFVLSGQADYGVNNIEDFKTFVNEAQDGIIVAVNGATSSEAFLAASLFASMGASDILKLAPYTSAAEAAQALARGEAHFAISHQSQILEPAEQGIVKVIAAFDSKPIEKGPFAGVEGVGQYGYPYFRNSCFVMARAGTDAKKIEELKALYDKVLADPEVSKWMEETMLIEVDPMTKEQLDEHVANVKSIINKYKDVVL